MLVKVFDVDQGRLNLKHFEVLKLWNCSLRLWLPWLEPSVSCSKLSIYDSTAQPTSQNVPFGTFKSGAARSALQNFINHIGHCARANELFLAQNISEPKWYLATAANVFNVLKPGWLKRATKTLALLKQFQHFELLCLCSISHQKLNRYWEVFTSKCRATLLGAWALT